MPSTRGFSLLLTASQAAARLGVPIETVLGWAATGQLRIAGQDEDGRALFREAVIDSRGEQLAELTLPGPRLRKRTGEGQLDAEDAPSLPCGCNVGRSPPRLCRNGAALNAAFQLADIIAVAMPNDPLLRKLVGICREALTKHLTAPAEITEGPANSHSSSVGTAGVGGFENHHSAGARRHAADLEGVPLAADRSGVPFDRISSITTGSPCLGQADRRIGLRSEDERYKGTSKNRFPGSGQIGFKTPRDWREAKRWGSLAFLI
jgi:hypothetical protein